MEKLKGVSVWIGASYVWYGEREGERISRGYDACWVTAKNMIYD